MIFTNGIVREISDNYQGCISSHPNHSSLSHEKVITQHKEYIRTLEALGLNIMIIPQDPNQPDCCFIEDTAVVFDEKVLITRMGAKDRRGETPKIKVELENIFSLTVMEAPATLDGGDVVQLENSFICGISRRTNRAGADFLSKTFDVSVSTIEDPQMVHLKSHVCYLGDNTIVASHRFINHPVLTKFEKILIPLEESYATNMININGKVLIPNGYSKTEIILKDHGYNVVRLDTSEFEKCEGALTCLSLRF